MANPITQIIITAVDKTKAAFASAKGGLDSIGNTAAAMRGMLANLFVGLSVVGFIGAMRRSIDSMDDASKSARAAGTSVEKFSALTYAAGQSGAGPEIFRKSLIGLATSLDDAKNGTGAAADAFQRLKIDPKQFSDPADALLVLADRFAAMPDGIDKTALAAAIFGKKIGPELIPLLNEGGAGIKRLTDEAAQLGKVMRTDATEAAEQFNDSLDRLKASSSGLGITLASDLLPSLNQYVSAFDDVLRNGSALDKIKFFTVGYITPEVLARIAKANQAIRNDSKDTSDALGENRRAEADAFTKSANEQISDADRLKGALQMAYAGALSAQEDYLRQAKKLRNEASGSAPVAGDAESQALANLDATAKLMRLQRTAGTESLETVQDQTQALRDLAGQLDDNTKKTEIIKAANLAEAAALEKASADEADRARGLSAQQDENLRRTNSMKDALEGISKGASVDITSGAQTKQTIDDLNTIMALIGKINTTPVSPGGGATGYARSMQDALRTESLQHGRRR